MARAPVSAAPSPEAETADTRKTVRVETVDELLKAIASDTIIELTGRSYNLMGIPVGEDYAGIIIRDGRKEMRRR